MVRLAGTISRLSSCKILVVGDLILDTYTIGKARRISPEAPVAVVHVTREENRPGGAGNVVLNLLSLGAEVAIIGRVGNDTAGQLLRESLAAEKADVRGLFIEGGFSTPNKNRIIAENQQVVRVDYEQVIPLSEMLEQQIIDILPELMQNISAIAISDYGKGFLSRTLLAAILDLGKARGIPVITDPKGIDFTKYSGTSIIKPNLSEAYAAAGLLPDSSLDLAAGKILEIANAQILMVTRSEAGISIFHRNGQREDFPVKVREIKDVTGAGDTVLAMLAYATANGLSIGDAAQLSNVAAGIAIERFGCARVTLSELAGRLLETDVVNKVFDAGHLFALKAALQSRSFNLLAISGAHGMTSTIFSSIHRLSKEANCDLVIYLLDDKPDEEFVNLLAALHDVKFIIVQSENLSSLCDTIKPANICAVVGKEINTISTIDELFKPVIAT